MRTCPECKAVIADPVTHCPLCGTELTAGEGTAPDEFLYPDFLEGGKKREPFPFLARIFAFISLIVVIACTLIDFLVSRRLSWSLYVTGTVAAAWASVGMHLLSDRNLNFLLLNDLCVVSLYLVLIDYLSGWHGWSYNYVIPVLYIGIMITTIILAIVFRDYWREYILSLVAVCFLGIAPLLIFFNNRSPFRYVCLAAALLAAALLVGIIFFAGGKLFSEWRRRMNL